VCECECVYVCVNVSVSVRFHRIIGSGSFPFQFES